MEDSLQRILGRYGKQDGELLLGGRKISAIVADHGTPLYVYESAALRKRAEELRAALPPELMITYAVKANPSVDLLRVVGPLYDGVDIASGGEMEKALAAGIPASRMSFAGPGKNLDELRYALEKGIGSISAESERELEHIERISGELGKPGKVMIRVNPAFELSRSGLKMGGGSKQFGIDSERVPALIRGMKDRKNLALVGIHIFAGTQNLSVESILETYDKIMEYAGTLSGETATAFEKVNLGGGFGIPYFRGDGVLDIAAVGAGIAQLIRKYRPALPKTQFKIELGRYLVGESGLYLARILYRKESRGSVYYVLDGGMHHHLPASGNMNQSPIRRQMHVTVVNKLDGPVAKANIVGTLCTPLDNFGLNVEVPVADEGDIVAIFNSGAYGLSISPTAFLSHKPPKETLI
jgi:diaminopimelate decarboxylase